jgi:aspartyl-tRNA(Asn)/glutamyl-tRNA(Gln) amidotransferase subunit A
MNGSTTCVEAVHFYLQQVKANEHLNAWLEIFEDEALERAAALDQKRTNGQPVGQLHGVAIGIKDVICYENHCVSAGSKILENFTSLYSATATRRLLEQDAIILGRQNCDEFAMGSTNENSAYGAVRNAADVERVPGGSSGGSAVAVQANMCMVSLGSDTGGSVRQPADFCGIVGLKPTYGTISRYGLIAYASSFDQIGIFGQTVEDVALVLDVISGVDEFDSTMIQKPFKPTSPNLETSKNKKYKLCYFTNAVDHPSLDPEISTGVKSFIETLREAGHTVEAVEFDLLEYVIPTYYVLTTAEASANLSRYDGVRYGHVTPKKSLEIADAYKASRSEGFGDEVKRRILLGTFVLSAGYFDAYFTKAQQVRRLLFERTEKIFQEYDAIILPTVPAPAYKLGEKKDPVEMFLADIYTVYANLVGIPGVSIPLFNTTKGLPFGLQVMTFRHKELLLLALAKTMMQLKRENPVL